MRFGCLERELETQLQPAIAAGDSSEQLAEVPDPLSTPDTCKVRVVEYVKRLPPKRQLEPLSDWEGLEE
jgi:hypothetical protein